MEKYFDALHDVNENSKVMKQSARADGSFSQVKSDTVAQLNAIGYEAYSVNPQNFEEVENALNTNLEDAGLLPNESYLIVVDGYDDDGSGISPQATSSEFKYTFRGKSYRMRWMTIYPDDSSWAMITATPVDLHNNQTLENLNNALSVALYVTAKIPGVSPEVKSLGKIV